MPDVNFVVITPAKNESYYLLRNIASMVSQTILPREWIIVDDGSSDDTALIAEAAARRHKWIRVVRLADQGVRDVDAGAIAAMYAALGRLRAPDYEFLVKLDSDIVLGPRYFESILAKFAENPRLGIATGVLFEARYGRWVKLKRLRELTTFGPIKCWRRQCFQEIGGLVRGPGWDGADNFRAIMLGWEANSFDDASLAVQHRRTMRSSIKNVYLGWARQGAGHYFLGSHPLWVLASALYHSLDWPPGLGGVAMLIGYWREFYPGSPRYYDEKFRNFLRQWQLRRLTALLKLA